jgi:hypothetical protein
MGRGVEQIWVVVGENEWEDHQLMLVDHAWVEKG